MLAFAVVNVQLIAIDPVLVLQVERVVGLVSALKAKIQSDGKAEQAVYDKYPWGMGRSDATVLW